MMFVVDADSGPVAEALWRVTNKADVARVTAVGGTTHPLCLCDLQLPYSARF
jgi:hypothetical protein